ncbi:hypothetical protein [Magnetococcus marinus]|uniref:hypothetical protein n=1 Tax=Magnetococcus marinus TaxID=1124597 RepID=UPI00003C5524|nr:hypothetical protein [Magnetococcus marinus]
MSPHGWPVNPRKAGVAAELPSQRFCDTDLRFSLGALMMAHSRLLGCLSSELPSFRPSL